MTKVSQDTFQIKISSHRGGRWYLDNRVLKILDKLGYLVDCTVTPGISWKSTSGQPEHRGEPITVVISQRFIK